MTYFAYVRVSTPRQGQVGTSLETQRRAIARYAVRHNLEIERWFEERETAARAGRPQFRAVLRALRNRDADGLVVHAVDRSSRNLKDWAELGELLDRGIDVRFVAESLDLRSRGGRLTADIQAVIAVDYVRNLRAEVRHGIDARLEQGLYPFRAPLGYLDCGGGRTKLPDPITAPFVRLAFERYATGKYSLVSLETELSGLGLRASEGGLIRANRLACMLRNPFYAGWIRTHRSPTLIRGAHEALIFQELFDRVQAVLDGRLRQRTTKHNFRFRRVFSCGTCHRSLVGETHKGHVYYRCHECRASVREEVLEAAVRGMLRRLDWNVAERAYLAARVVLAKSAATRARENEHRALVLLRNKLERRLASLLDGYLDHTIDQARYETTSSDLRTRCARIDLELASRTRMAAPTINSALVALLDNPAHAYSCANEDERRDLVRLLSAEREVRDKIASLKLLRPFQDLAGPSCTGGSTLTR
jgi:site-specific DNA recombinase